MPRGGSGGSSAYQGSREFACESGGAVSLDEDRKQGTAVAVTAHSSKVAAASVSADASATACQIEDEV